jgi:exosortase
MSDSLRSKIMTPDERLLASPDDQRAAAPPAWSSLLAWPRSAWLFWIAVALLYAPVIVETAKLWMTDDNYSHGAFIFPISAFVLYLQRKQIRETPLKPVAWGLLPLALGLLLQSGSYLMHIRYVSMWSIVLTLAGGILIFYGKEIWKIARFAVFFLLFAAPIPYRIIDPPSKWIRSASTTGAAITMKGLGYALIQKGNKIEVPGYALEVADVCSGFKKTVALLAFSLLYGYMFQIGIGKRALLVLAAVPIGIAANILRVSGLIAVTMAGGLPALHVAHDWGELTALGIAFLMFIGVGKLIGCRTLRFA